MWQTLMAGLWQAFDRLDGKLLTSLQICFCFCLFCFWDKLAAIQCYIWQAYKSLASLWRTWWQADVNLATSSSQACSKFDSLYNKLTSPWPTCDKLDGQLMISFWQTWMASLQQVPFDKLAATLTSPLQACDKLGGKLMVTLQQVFQKYATNLIASQLLASHNML